MADEKKTEHDYILETQFTYSHGGDQTEAQFIRLLAPTSKHSKECAALKQAFFRAQRSLMAMGESMRPEETEETEELPGPEDVIIMLAMSSDVELSDVLDVARRLFTSGLAMIEGETKLTNPLIDRMDQEDFEKMLGSFLVNFTLASALTSTKGK